MTVLATVLAAPLLLVEIAPGADASPDAALTAFRQDVEDATEADAAAEQAAPTPDGRAVGSLSSDDLAGARLLSPLTSGDEIRAAAEEQDAVEALTAIEQAREDERAAVAEAEAEREAAQTTTTAPPPPPPPPPPAPEPQPAVAPAGGPSPAQWAALRHCESSGNYAAYNGAGPFYGAYQFMQSTWDSTARRSGRTDLVGVHPHQAAPADQDAMAYALYGRRGSSPWPHCGRHLH